MSMVKLLLSMLLSAIYCCWDVGKFSQDSNFVALHCIKYARIRVFTDPYSPVWGQKCLFVLLTQDLFFLNGVEVQGNCEQLSNKIFAEKRWLDVLFFTFTLAICNNTLDDPWKLATEVKFEFVSFSSFE